AMIGQVQLLRGAVQTMIQGYHFSKFQVVMHRFFSHQRAATFFWEPYWIFEISVMPVSSFP
ncbi:MAG: hypothetical protein AAGF75_12375, partial [Cyanobacteria bacterium P01_H01_bin.130]